MRCLKAAAHELRHVKRRRSRFARLVTGLGLAAMLAGGLAVLWWLWEPAPLAARFGPEACRNVALTDAATGQPIRGVEDIARTPGGDLILSAYDRLAAEAALGAGRRPPDGGLYRLPPQALDQPQPIALSPLIPAQVLGGGLHPHGIAMAGDDLLVINRRLADPGRSVAVLRLSLGPEDARLSERVVSDGLCAANDLVARPGGAWITLDREGCRRRTLGDLLDLSTGRVVALSGRRITSLADGFAHPNGILASPAIGETAPIVAETRAGRLRLPGGRTVDLPGGPDNLSTSEGRIVAALHPSLLRLALYRYGWAGRAPLRVVSVAASGEVEILLDDPSGRLFSAATVALWAGPGRLVAGSVRDDGLLICEEGA